MKNKDESISNEMAALRKKREGKGALHMITRPIKAVCDPITQTCYPVLESHWKERYRKLWPEKYARRMLILDFFLLTVIATLIVSGMIFYFLLPAPEPVPALVSVETLSPRTLTSGEATEFVVSYRNDSTRTLGCAELRLRLPADTVVVGELGDAAAMEKFCLVAGETPRGQYDPDEPGVIVYPIGDLSPNERDIVRVKARTYGPTGSLKVFAADLSYSEEARTAPTRSSSRQEWAVAGTVLPLDVATPKDLVRGRQTSVTVRYENRGKEELRDVRIAVTPPADFAVSGAVPALGRGREWRLGELAPGENGTVTLYGTFSGRPGTPPTPAFAFRATAEDGGTRVVLEEARHNADPLAGDIEFSHEIISPSGRIALLPGEEVVVAVRYRNRGEAALTNLRVTLEADRRLLDAESQEDIVWDASSVAALASVAPGQEATLTTKLVVKRVIDAATLGPDGEPHLVIAATASYVRGDDATRPVRVDSAPTDFPIATSLTVDATALYFTKDGDQLGLGPLPPKVGETTKYRIFFHMKNTTGGADNVRVEGYLPPSVAWTGKYSVTSGQAIDYFPTTGKVRWDVGRVPAYVDGTGAGIGASFEVAFTPTEEDAMTMATLIKNISLSADDELTGLTLHASTEPVTTQLPFDSRAAGKGTVVK